MRWEDLDRQACSLTRTLSVVGDRWTLLVLRDCFLRVRRFEDFQARLGIGRGILADRLRKLTDADILAKVAYREAPTRHEYRLTPKGLDLYPLIMAMVHWGDSHMAGDEGRPVLHRHDACGHVFDPVLTCSACGRPVDARGVHVLPGPGAGDPRHLARAEPPGAHARHRTRSPKA